MTYNLTCITVCHSDRASRSLGYASPSFSSHVPKALAAPAGSFFTLFFSFFGWLQAAKVPLNEYEFPANKIANIQSQLEKLVEKNYYLHQSARDAYRSYILAYNSHQLKHIFNVHQLNLLAVAKSFGFSSPPKVRVLHPRTNRMHPIRHAE
jgi:Domain of unknown function (DUF4217)